MHGFGIHVTHCSFDQIFNMSYPFKSNLRSLAGSFLSSSVSRESACSVGDLGSIPGSGRSPGEGNGKPLQYPCLEKSHGLRSLVTCSPWIAELGMSERLTLGHWYGQVAFVFTMNHQLKKQSISKIIACNVGRYGNSHILLHTAEFEQNSFVQMSAWHKSCISFIPTYHIHTHIRKLISTVYSSNMSPEGWDQKTSLVSFWHLHSQKMCVYVVI